MRKGSNFVGTEKDLENVIRKYLPKFTSDIEWIDDIEQNVSEQEFTNICEAMAEAISRGYVKEKVNVHYMMNGTISFSHVDTSPNNKPQTYGLSDLGKQFLGL